MGDLTAHILGHTVKQTAAEVREIVHFYMQSNFDIVQKVGAKFLKKRGMAVQQYVEWFQRAETPFDELSIFLFGRICHLHIGIIMRDYVWCTHVDEDWEKVGLFLIYHGDYIFSETVVDPSIVKLSAVESVMDKEPDKEPKVKLKECHVRLELVPVSPIKLGKANRKNVAKKTRARPTAKTSKASEDTEEVPQPQPEPLVTPVSSRCRSRAKPGKGVDLSVKAGKPPKRRRSTRGTLRANLQVGDATELIKRVTRSSSTSTSEKPSKKTKVNLPAKPTVRKARKSSVVVKAKQPKTVVKSKFSMAMFGVKRRQPRRKSKDKAARKQVGGAVFECKKCDRIYQSQAALSKHVKYHGDRRFKCKHCEKSFVFDFEHKEHALSHSKRKRLGCPSRNCKHTFITKKALDVHMEVHSNFEYVCESDGCPFKTKRKAAYRTHYVGKHSGGLTCKCGFHCDWPSQMLRHTNNWCVLK